MSNIIQLEKKTKKIGSSLNNLSNIFLNSNNKQTRLQSRSTSDMFGLLAVVSSENVADSIRGKQ